MKNCPQMNEIRQSVNDTLEEEYPNSTHGGFLYRHDIISVFKTDITMSVLKKGLTEGGWSACRL